MTDVCQTPPKSTLERLKTDLKPRTTSIRDLCDSTRLPAGAINEDAIELLWKAIQFDDQAQQGKDNEKVT